MEGNSNYSLGLSSHPEGLEPVWAPLALPCSGVKQQGKWHDSPAQLGWES